MNHELDDEIGDEKASRGGTRKRVRSRKKWYHRVSPLAVIYFFAILFRLVLLDWFADLPPKGFDERKNQEQAGIAVITKFHSPLKIWDERDYDTLATNLFYYGEFSFDKGEPASLRPPLFPFFLCTVYQFFGLGAYQAARAFQVVLSLVTIFLVYDLGTRVYDRKTAVVAAGFYAFYPSLLVDNYLILTETLFTFFLIAGVWSLIRGFQEESFWWVPASGVLFGLGALTRSVLWVFIPVLSVYVFLCWKGTWKPRLIASGAVFLAAALTIAPWSIRNTMLEKTFLAIDSMGGRNLMMGNYEYTPLHRSWDAISITGEKSWDAVLAKAEPESLKSTQGQKDKMAMRYAIKFALTHPFLTMRRDTVKFFDFWGLEREQIAGAARGWFGPIPKPAIVVLGAMLVGAYVFGLFLGIFGGILSPPSDRRAFGLMLLVIGFICTMHSLSFGHSRYHLPLMPLILTFGAAAVVKMRSFESLLSRRSFWYAAGVCGVFTLAWAWDLLAVEGDRVTQVFGS